MRWEELTGDEFPQAVQSCEGVCLVPLSVIERHAHHLPLGTDMYIGRELCQRAAALEPAIVFPDYIFGQILEARHCPGTIAIDAEVMLALFDNVCREIARNGLHKIVLVNAHGGNNALNQFFLQIQLQKPRDYVVYLAEPRLSPQDEAALKAQWESTYDGHAGEIETSAILAIRPALVRPDALYDDGEGKALGRLNTLREEGVRTGIWWYADHPTHYSGDGNPATAEKGNLLLDAEARALARAIRAIKADTTARQLQDTFFAQSQHNPSAG